MKRTIIILLSLVGACAQIDASPEVDLKDVPIKVWMGQIERNQAYARNLITEMMQGTNTMPASDKFLISKFATTFLATYDIPFQKVVDGIDRRIGEKWAKSHINIHHQQDKAVVNKLMGAALVEAEKGADKCLKFSKEIRQGEENVRSATARSIQAMAELHSSYLDLYMKVST